MKNNAYTIRALSLAALLIDLASSPSTAWAAPAGKLVAWGNNEFGQTNVPPGSNFVAIAARQNYHGLALRSDGSLAGWGWNYGEPDFGAAGVFYGQAIAPPGGHFKAVAVGAFHSLALRTDGSLVAWGANESGQTNVPAGNDFVAIAAGDWHNFALRSDGSIVAWGGHNFQINGIFVETDFGQRNVPAGNDFVAITSGDFHGVAQRSDGSLIAWGSNNAGQLNVPSGSNFVAIAAGWPQNLALKSDGSMVGWGGNVFGQATPRAATNYVAVAGGWHHSLALKSDGSLTAWGQNDFGQTNVPTGTNFVAIAGGWRHSVAIQAQPQTPTQSTYEPYIFTTLAGGGGFSTNAAGNAGSFSFLTVAADGAGNLYVAEQANNIISKVTPDGAVTILAGRPALAGSADGMGSDARFSGPSHLAVDAAGNVFVADTFNCTIRKVTPSGVVTTLAGLAGSPGSADGIGSAARFNYPFGMGVDNSGNIYVGDSDNHTIRKLTLVGTNWVVTTLAGRAGAFGVVDGIGNAARFNFPGPVVADSAGNLYVGDGFGHTIRKLAPVGSNWVVSTIAGRAGVRGTTDGIGSAALFNEPNVTAIDSAGNLFVADFRGHTIRKLTPTGTSWVVTTLAGRGGQAGSANGTNSDARFDVPNAVAIGSADQLYVADGVNGLIRKMTLTETNWAVTTFAGVGGIFGSEDGHGISGRFYGPGGVAVGPSRPDGEKPLFIADSINHTVRSVTAGGGIVETLAGKAGYAGTANGTGNVARFNYPYGIAVDNSGNVYVTETVNHTLRKLRPDASGWVVTTLAGSPDAQGPGGNGGSADGTGSAARFSFPRGLAIDTAGNLYVADWGNTTIRRVTPAGVVTTLAGSAGGYGSNDGVGVAARFNQPSAVAVDAATNIYVADTYNHTIRKITPARVVSTLAGLAGSPDHADGLGSAARFDFPTGIAVDLTGNLYVTDGYNNTIRKLKLVGTNWVVTTLGGMPGFYGTADGTGYTARFANPNGIAVDGEGNLYVADFYFNTIRKGYPGPRLLDIGFFGDRFQFGLTGPGRPEPTLVIVETSTDLLSWQPISTNGWADLANSPFRDAPANVFTNRFYRVRVP